MIIKNVHFPSPSSRNTSLSKSKYSTTRTSAAASEPRTISPPRGSNPSSVQCPWDWTKDGIKSSLTFPISHVEPMAVTTSRHYASQSTPTAESEGSTSPTVSTPRKNCLHNSNCFSLSKNSSDSIYHRYYTYHTSLTSSIPPIIYYIPLPTSPPLLSSISTHIHTF